MTGKFIRELYVSNDTYEYNANHQLRLNTTDECCKKDNEFRYEDEYKYNYAYRR